MSGFSNYEDQRRQRSAFTLGAAAVGLGAVLVPASRRFLTGMALEGLEQVGRLARSRPPSGLAQVGAELGQLLERTGPQAARAALGEKAAREFLETALHTSGRYSGQGASEQVQRHLNQILTDDRFRRFLLNNTMEVEELLRPGSQVRGVFDEFAGQGLNGQVWSGRFRSLLTDARASVPRHGEVLADPTFREIRDRLQDAARQQLREHHMAGRRPDDAPGRLGQWVRGRLGLEDIRLGDVPQPGDVWYHHLQELLGDEAANLRVGNQVRFQGKVYDLSGARQVGQDALRWLESHFQVPLAPGTFGISPFQLFPWAKGRSGAFFDDISAVAKDATLRALVGSETPLVGKDIFKVGDRFFAADYTAAAGQGLRELGAQGEFRSGIYGFMRRRAAAVEAANAAKAQGGRDPLRGGIFGKAVELLGFPQHGDTKFTRLASVFTKYGEGSNWAPRVLERLLDPGVPAGQVALDDFQRATGFLTGRGLSHEVGQQAAKYATQADLGLFGFADPDLRDALQRLDRDQGVLDFFNRMVQLGAEGSEHGVPQSTALQQMLAQYRASPQAALGRYRPGVDRTVWSLPLTGKEPDQRGIDLMRQAIYGEAEHRIALGTETHPERGFLEWLKGQNLKDAARQDAEAYGWGRLMQRRADPRLGQQGDLKSERVQEAIGIFRRSAEAQQAVSEYTRRYAKAWETHVEGSDVNLRTGNLFVRHGMIGQFNQSLRSGRSFRQAIGDSLRAGVSGAIGFATGNPAHVTADTVFLEYFPRRLNDGLAEAGLGLPAQDLGSGLDVWKGLFMRRVGPLWAAYEGYRYLDYKLNGTGLAPSDLLGNAKSNLARLRAAKTGESTFGVRRELLPGLETILPERSLEEEREHQAHGVDPVRKGRFWAIGSRGSFWGEKVDLYLPEASRLAKSHWQEASNVDLNGREYWRHHLLPTLENPLGPLGVLLSGRGEKDWFERKHAADRPYLTTSELADPDTLHGPLVNATIGAIFKPKRVLHPEYLPKRLGGTASREQLRRINEAIKRGDDRPALQKIMGAGTPADGFGGLGAGGRGGESFIGSPGVLPLGGTGSDFGSGSGGAGGGRGNGRGVRGAVGVVTPSGQLEARTLPAGMDQQSFDQLGNSSNQTQGWAARLSRREMERTNRQMKLGLGGGGKQRPGSSQARLQMSRGPWDPADLDMVNYQSGLISGARQMVDVAGLYGFGFEATVGPIEQDGLIVPTAAYAKGPNRRFYEAELGGLGGELSEVGRRFMARRQRRDGEYNPLPNNAAAWLPGPEYMVDFHHGDQFLAVKHGELRLPGEAYERTHDVRLMQTRASSLGKSEAELMRQMLFIEEPLSDYGESVTQRGDEIHRALQRRWKRMGVLMGAEFLLKNEGLGISGHPDAILDMVGGPTLTDIKTVSGKRFAQAKVRPFDEHVSQFNWYLSELRGRGVRDTGFLTYVNRDDPTQIAFQQVRFDPGRLDRDLSKVQRARHRLLGLVQKNVISRGDLYDPITRFEILADTSPYSENYAQVREYLTTRNRDGELSEEENARFQAAKKRVAEQKRPVQTWGYRFKNVALDRQSFVVDRIIDANTFTVRGQESPIRLAGVASSAARAEEVFGPAPEGKSAAEWQWEQFGVRPGSRVRVDLDADPERRVERDTYRTMHGVVYAGHRNVNRELLQQGVATEKEGDRSSPGIAARFTESEIRKGATWERFSHMHTLLHDKFLRVRSPLEELERGIVFGKRTGSWNHPWRDFVAPTVENAMSKNPLVAGALLGSFAGFFFGKQGMKGKAMLIGAGVGAALSIGRGLWEDQTGETWKPYRTRRREEIEQYFDVLKYLKARGLAAQEEKLAKQKEGVDVERMVRDLYQEGQSRERRRHWLEGIQREIKLGRREETDLPKGFKSEQEIQDEIDRLSQPQGMLKLGPHAQRALQHRNQFRSTLYGIDPNESPFANVFKAIPKYKRELVEGWIHDSDPQERQRIFDLLPKAEQRVLGGYLGIDPAKIPDRPTLRGFFRDHPLPGKDWAGWDPKVNLEQLRMRALRYEGLDPMDSGIFELQIDEAEQETAGIPVPTLQGKSTHIQRTLNDLLSGRGFRNLRVTVDVQPHDGDNDHVDLHLDLHQRREQDLRDALQFGR